MSLFRASTGEDWTDMMYINALGCDKFDGYPYNIYPELCTAPGAMPGFAEIFFSFFMLIAGSVLLTLFIGIICAEMDSMTELQNTHHHNQEQVAKFKKMYNVSDKEVGAYGKLFNLIQELKSGVTADVDIVEVKGVLMLLDTMNPDDSSQAMDDEGLRSAFSKFDADGAGYLDMFEFVCMMYAMRATNHSISDADVETVSVSNKVTFTDIGMSSVMDKMNDKATGLMDKAKDTAKDAADKVGKTLAETGRRASLIMHGTTELAESVTSSLVGDKPATFVHTLASYWTKFGNWNMKVTEDETFNSFMLLVVVFAGILVGIQVGYAMTENAILAVLDWIGRYRYTLYTLYSLDSLYSRCLIG
jgi:Ca2+-binding EF-hand superfamily protein